MTNKKTSEVLRAARELISDPKRWTTRAYARTRDGHILSSGWDATATCWCSVGAVEHAVGERGLMLDRATYQLGYAIGTGDEWGSIVDFNDSHTHEEVLNMFDKAIQMCEVAGD